MIGAPRPEGEGKRRPGSIRRLLSNTGFVMGAEVVSRVTRIAAAVALAYAFDVVTFGFAVAALTTHELVRMFIQNGLGTRIVAVEERGVVGSQCMDLQEHRHPPYFLESRFL